MKECRSGWGMRKKEFKKYSSMDWEKRLSKQAEWVDERSHSFGSSAALYRLSIFSSSSTEIFLVVAGVVSGSLKPRGTVSGVNRGKRLSSRDKRLDSEEDAE